jgi:hypothetical protein
MPVSKVLSRTRAWLRHQVIDRISPGNRGRAAKPKPRAKKPKPRPIHASVWIAAAAAIVAAAGFILVGPLKDPSKFYGTAVLVMPAFLIAVAVERTTLGSLGTKADFARVQRDETVDSYRQRGLDAGVRNTIEFALMARTKAGFPHERDMLSISVGPVDIAKAAVVGNWDEEPFFWSVFRDQLHDEFGLPSDDPDFFDPPQEWVDPSSGFEALRESVLSPDPGDAIRLLATHAALREDREFGGGSVGLQLVGAELKRLFAAQHDAALESVLSRVTYRANREYDRQLRQRTASLCASIVLLTATELLALIGLMSPGRPYSGLFVVTAAAVVASIMNVAGGALADIAGLRRRQT